MPTNCEAHNDSINSPLRSVMKLALVQLKVLANKQLNVQRACEKIKEAVSVGGADVVCLPEFFSEHAESIPGETSESLAASAKENGCYLVGGSIPERDNENRLFNTSCAFNPDGEMIGKFRKIHLFDIDVPGKIRFMESDVLTAGNKLFNFVVGPTKGKSFQPVSIGVAICYDIRFPALAAAYRNLGCHLLIYPAAFNMTTGPLHWELLQRARAADNQMYVAACSPARDESSDYVSWAQSSVVDPWAKVVAKAAEEETILYADIDPDELEAIRSSIPILKQVRSDLYSETEWKGS